MTYISAVAQRWPIFRVAARIILAFALATPLTWLLSNLVVDGLAGR
jgi:hypothetical protein